MRIPWKDRIIAAWHCLCGHAVAFNLTVIGEIEVTDPVDGMIAHCKITGPVDPPYVVHSCEVVEC